MRSEKGLFLAFLVLGQAAAALAAPSVGWRAPPWACSPAPLRRNILCPTPADGDKQRCNAISCLPDAGCATEDCNAVEGNIAADGIVALDAWMQRGTTCVKHSWSLADCCRLCQFTERCNAWSYCNNPAGCGQGCEGPQHNFLYDPNLNLWQLDPQDYPARLNPEHRCQANGAWPYQTCTLKYVSGEIDVKNPPLQAGAASNGWVSGSAPRIVNPAPVPAELSSGVDPAEQAILDGFYDEGGFESGGIVMQEQADVLEQGAPGNAQLDSDSIASDTLVVEQLAEEKPKHHKRKGKDATGTELEQPDNALAGTAASSSTSSGSASTDAHSLELDSSVADLITKSEAQLPPLSPEITDLAALAPTDSADSTAGPASATATTNSTAAVPPAGSAPITAPAVTNPSTPATPAAVPQEKQKEENSSPRILAPAKIHVSEAQIKVLSVGNTSTKAAAAASTAGAAETNANAAFGSTDLHSWQLLLGTLLLGMLWQVAVMP